MGKYLDGNGLLYCWNKIKDWIEGLFYKKSETYTKNEFNDRWNSVLSDSTILEMTYSKEHIDEELSRKAELGTVYSKSEFNGILTSKNSYTKSEVDNLLSGKLGVSTESGFLVGSMMLLQLRELTDPTVLRSTEIWGGNLNSTSNRFKMLDIDEHPVKYLTRFNLSGNQLTIDDNGNWVVKSKIQYYEDVGSGTVLEFLLLLVKIA